MFTRFNTRFKPFQVSRVSDAHLRDIVAVLKLLVCGVAESLPTRVRFDRLEICTPTSVL